MTDTHFSEGELTVFAKVIVRSLICMQQLVAGCINLWKGEGSRGESVVDVVPPIDEGRNLEFDRVLAHNDLLLLY